MTDFYPSAKVQLLVRFEEYKRFDLVDRQKPEVPTKNLKGTSDNRAPLVSVLDPNAPAGVSRYLITDKSQETAHLNSPWAEKDSLGTTQTIDGIIPKSASWQQNGFRKGDTLKLTFKYSDMPFDPRVIRSCGVRFYLGTVDPTDYAAGIRGATRATERGTAESLNMIPSTYRDRYGGSRSNLRFIGWVNTWGLSINDSAEPTLDLECQDNTTLFINQPAPAQLSLAGNLPIHQAIAQYLSHFAQFEGIGVEYRPFGAKIPTLSGVLAGSAHVPALSVHAGGAAGGAKGAAGGAKGAAGPPITQGGGSGGDSGNSTTVWDYLTDCCGAIGHMVYVDMIDDAPIVVVEETRNVYDGKRVKRPGDPHLGRTVDGRYYEQRAMIFGVNVLDLKGKHEYTRKSVSGIEVRCFSTERKNMLVARYPDKGDRPSRVLPGDKVDDKWLVRHVHGVTDLAALKKIAQNYFNVVGRNELSWDIKTRDLCSYGGTADDPDLLDMRAGDAFELLIDRGEHHVVTATEKRLTSFANGGEHLSDLGYSKEFAAAYARAYTSAGFQTLFKLSEMQVEWEIEKGIDITMKGINFVEVRADPKNFDSVTRPSENREVSPAAPLKQTPDEEDASRAIIERERSGRFGVGIG
jgi:hypothetical protein